MNMQHALIGNFRGIWIQCGTWKFCSRSAILSSFITNGVLHTVFSGERAFFLTYFDYANVNWRLPHRVMDLSKWLWILSRRQVETENKYEQNQGCQTDVLTLKRLTNLSIIVAMFLLAVVSSSIFLGTLTFAVFSKIRNCTYLHTNMKFRLLYVNVLCALLYRNSTRKMAPTVTLKL